jgi:hypothetical protein
VSEESGRVPSEFNGRFCVEIGLPEHPLPLKRSYVTVPVGVADSVPVRVAVSNAIALVNSFPDQVAMVPASKTDVWSDNVTS